MAARIVYKYPIEAGSQFLRLPIGAKILHGDIQNGAPVIWALVDPNQSLKTSYSVLFIGTGHPFQDGGNWKHLSTVQSGSFVFHFFTGAHNHV